MKRVILTSDRNERRTGRMGRKLLPYVKQFNIDANSMQEKGGYNYEKIYQKFDTICK